MWLTTLGVVQPPTVLVVDYGAQYAQLIARPVSYTHLTLPTILLV